MMRFCEESGAGLRRVPGATGYALRLAFKTDATVLGSGTGW